MRRLLLLLFAGLVVACSSSQELAPTTSVVDATTSTASASTTTTLPRPSTILDLPTTTSTTLAPLSALAYEEVAQMAFPIQMVARPGATDSYIATKEGRVWIFDGSSVGESVLDIRDQVFNDGERGLLSIALHPDDTNRFFAHYTDNGGDTVVSEFGFDGRQIDPASERFLLRVDQPAGNHNGGMIQFGPDGRLYVGLGDGGGSNDRFGNGQNRQTLLGGIVGVAVDGEPNSVLFQYGLRNPWRFWIDQESETVYIADVGQNAYEEVSVAPFEANLNFGWPITEGLHCFRPPSGCDTAGLTLPVVEVNHGNGGTCSITGGVVYDGSAIPELAGHFFYSDFCGGYLRSLVWSDGQVVDEVDWTGDVGVPGQVVGFGVDGAREMYVMTTGRVLRVVAIRD